MSKNIFHILTNVETFPSNLFLFNYCRNFSLISISGLSKFFWHRIQCRKNSFLLSIVQFEIFLHLTSKSKFICRNKSTYWISNLWFFSNVEINPSSKNISLIFFDYRKISIMIDLYSWIFSNVEKNQPIKIWCFGGRLFSNSHGDEGNFSNFWRNFFDCNFWCRNFSVENFIVEKIPFENVEKILTFKNSRVEKNLSKNVRFPY